MMQPMGRKGLLLSGTVGLVVRHRQLLEGAPLSPGMEVAFILISIALVCISGLAAGLTLGLLSLDRVDLEVVKRTGTPKQRWLAERVEPLLRNPHWLLTSLLLLNAAAFEALPIFLDRLLNPVAAILISVTAILIFGEVLPQAVCKRYGMHIGAYLSWLVRIIMIVTAPVSWPIGKVLDWLLGEETALFRRAELRALVTLHAEDGEESMLTAEEVQVIHGALDMAHKTAETAMTPLDKVFMISSEDTLDKDLLQRIIDCGHSRIPVYEVVTQETPLKKRTSIVGCILVKELVLLDLHQGVKVRECRLRELDYISCDTPLYSVMELFRLKRKHMAVLTRVLGLEASADGGTGKGGFLAKLSGNSNTVISNMHDGGDAASTASTASNVVAPVSTTRSPSKGGGLMMLGGSNIPATIGAKEAVASAELEIVGIITIEDVIEELLQHEIVDETDVFVDNLQTEAVLHGVDASTQTLPPELSKYISFRRRRKGPSAHTSPNRPLQGAVVAAAAGAAYAAARASNMPARRTQSTGVLQAATERLQASSVGEENAEFAGGKDAPGSVSDVH